MAKRAPKKGAPLWHPLPNAPDEYSGVEVAIKFVGAKKAKRWVAHSQKLALEERARQLGDCDLSGRADRLTAALKSIASGADNPRAIAEAALEYGGPELSAKLIEYGEKLAELSAEVLQECVMGVRGVEGLAEDDAEGALELIEYLGEEVEAGVYHLAQEQQSLTLRQQFRAARAGE